MKAIVFSTEEVMAILDGRKTQFRRLMKPQPQLNNGWWQAGISEWPEGLRPVYMPCYWFKRNPYYKGDTLYVRETWCQMWNLDGNDQIIEGTEKYYYRADNKLPPYTHILKKDGSYTEDWIWRPSIHMPKEAARIFLKVKAVRIERLQDISSSDAWCEAFRCTCMYPIPACAGNRNEFISEWDKKNGEGCKWADNPWVWVMQFERVEEERNE